jgi:CheY-like chemotaxis protein
VDRPLRLLLITADPDRVRAGLPGAEVIAAAGLPDAAGLMRAGAFDLVVTDAAQAAERIARFRRDEIILANVDEGIAAVAPDGRVTWANPVLRGWCGGDPVGRPLLAALGTTADGTDPVAAALAGRPAATRLGRPDAAPAHVDVRVRPVTTSDGTVTQAVAIVRNVSAEVEQQTKLSALYAAGRELAALQPDQIAEMDPPTRVELLKKNLRRHVRDLLHYDTVEVRTLDRRTGELKPLLQDGMTPEAANRRLYARPDANGVTGHVAYTGDSYLCPDTAHDPYYLEGAAGARSSLTVPLKVDDEVVGTLNVESPRVNGFGPDDVHFTELYAKGLAEALHTFDLLSAQVSCTLNQSIEAVNREIALPVDELLASAALLYARLHATDPDAAAHLRRIMGNARQVKECVHKVGRDMTEPDPAADPTPLTGKRVLVVEQDERFRRQAHLLLGRLGAEVETVGTATEGLALAGEVGYDAVLQELRPADMGGYDAFRRFRVARPAARVALTTGFGYDSQHSIVKARQDGLQHVIFKPFRADQVVTAVTAPEPPPPAAAPIAAVGHT